MDTVATQRRNPLGTALRTVVALALAATMSVGSPSLEQAVAAGPAVRLVVTAPATARAGSALAVTVTARDSTGAVATSYRGRVRFTSTDTRSPVLPAAYTFTAADAGRRTFTGVRLFTAGSQTVAAFDTVRAALKGRSAPVTVTAGPVSRLSVTGPTTATAGLPVTLTVTARDRWSNRVTGYRGTVALTSTDPGAVLPAPVTFVAVDRGARAVPGVTLVSAGTRTVTARDTAVPTLAGTSRPVTVVPRYAAYAWGHNSSGQLGNGTFDDRSAPGLVGTDTRWRSVFAGFAHTLAIRTDGTLWSWGSNYHGELGNRITASARPTPARVGTRADWAQVATGSHHTLGLKSNGTLWAWGRNLEGQLGDGTTVDRWAPVAVGADRRWALVEAGPSRTFAVASDGTLWAWGSNEAGLLGDGTTTSRAVPVRVGTAADWVDISAGVTHTLGLRADGTVWSWGWNQWGELGNGTQTTEHLTPVRVGDDSDWTSVTAGSVISYAMKADGSLWGWGLNHSGDLGAGPSAAVLTPLDVSDGARWRSVATSQGGGTSYAIRTDGTLWTWGPTRGRIAVGGSTSWVEVAAGGSFAVGLTSRLLTP